MVAPRVLLGDGRVQEGVVARRRPPTHRLLDVRLVSWGGQGGGSLLDGTAARTEGGAAAASAKDVPDVGAVVLDSDSAQESIGRRIVTDVFLVGGPGGELGLAQGLVAHHLVFWSFPGQQDLGHGWCAAVFFFWLEANSSLKLSGACWCVLIRVSLPREGGFGDGWTAC